MSIDLSKVTALSDQYGAWEQVADASGRVIWSAAPALINFTIAGNAYQAEEGMTWGEWVDSEYNTGGYTNKTGSYGNVVLWGTGGVTGVKTATSVVVQQSDVIISNHSYIHGVVDSYGGND